MLQEEFFELTKVNLTGEEYAKVEAIYNNVQMNKDEFCKLWLENRDNKIIEELMVTIHDMYVKYNELEAQHKEDEKLLEKQQEDYETELKNIGDSYKEYMEKFGRKMIVNADDDYRRYDDICEEFGMDFICKVKLEEDIELEGDERNYLISKL